MVRQFIFECPECQEHVEIEHEPEELPQTYGPWEDCHPGAPERFTPDACPECGEVFNPEDMHEKINSLIQQWRD